MLSFLENRKLIPVQLLIHCSHFQTSLTDNFDGAGNTGHSMLAEFNRAESTTSHLASNLIVLAEVGYSFKCALMLE